MFVIRSGDMKFSPVCIVLFTIKLVISNPVHPKTIIMNAMTMKLNGIGVEHVLDFQQ